MGDTFSVAEEPEEEPAARNSLTYSEVVDDYMQWERQYLRDLQMLLKVFREQLADKLEQENEVSMLEKSKVLTVIFVQKYKFSHFFLWRTWN